MCKSFQKLCTILGSLVNDMKGNIRSNKNAFGEVHHNLIREVLEYHHIPDHVKNLINSLYTGFQTSVITENFNTRFSIVTVAASSKEVAKKRRIKCS